MAIGLVVGAGIALFLAPARGRETRRALRRRLRRAGRTSRDAWWNLGQEFTTAQRRWRRERKRKRLERLRQNPVESA